MKLIFATNNQHKIKEVQAVLPSEITIITLKEAGLERDIPEPYQTLEENAAEKARTIYSLTQIDCFSEDTGLEVFALGGEPGVHSARYSGAEASSQKNIEKLLYKLQPFDDRSAQFRTVVFLILGKKEFLFEGICKGRIINHPKGERGFGYDAIFIPYGADRTFAEMTLEEKDKFSHRRKAMDKLVEFLKELSENKYS